MVNQNLQFLIFGQMIPEGGFKHDEENQQRKGVRTFKSMKTKDLSRERAEEIERLDDTTQYTASK